MRCARLTDSEATPTLLLADIPRPAPARGEVLIQVRAAGVTPTELVWYPTTHTHDGAKRTGAIPGHEFSGVVAELGDGVEDFAIGDEVYGMNDWFAQGATAEYCVTVSSSIARKPSRLTHAEAAAVPIGALTAWQGLFDHAKLQACERLLVHGGAGAVGLFVVQLARMHGADVIATTSAATKEFVAQLGATQVIDYQAERFESLVRDVDVVFDCVGGDTLARSWQVLKPGGQMITIAASAEATNDPRVKEAFFIVEPNQRQLVEVGELLNAGLLRVFVGAEIPLEDAPAAYASQLQQRRGYGKVVITKF